MQLFSDSADNVAPRLLGCELIVLADDGTKTGGIIVETEAYDQTDEASHTFRGKTKRNAAMFAEPGAAYVYFTYGMHLCMNVSVQEKDFGAAVLIRAIEPTIGEEIMWQRRFKEVMPSEVSDKKRVQLTNGPAKLTQALNVTLADNFQLVNASERIAVFPNQGKNLAITQTTRVGISKAIDVPRRWYLTNNQWVSRK